MSDKGKITAFLERDGLVQRNTKRVMRHGKRTANAWLNNLINATLIVVCLVGYNSFTGNTEGARMVRSQDTANFVSYESGVVTILDNGQEAQFKTNGVSWVDVQSFQTCDAETSDFLTRCVMYSEFVADNPGSEVGSGPTLTRTTLLPSFVWGTPAPMESNILFDAPEVE